MSPVPTSSRTVAPGVTVPLQSNVGASTGSCWAPAVGATRAIVAIAIMVANLGITVPYVPREGRVAPERRPGDEKESQPRPSHSYEPTHRTDRGRALRHIARRTRIARRVRVRGADGLADAALSRWHRAFGQRQQRRAMPVADMADPAGRREPAKRRSGRLPADLQDLSAGQRL